MTQTIIEQFNQTPTKVCFYKRTLIRPTLARKNCVQNAKEFQIISETSTLLLFVKMQNLCKTKKPQIWEQKCVVWVFLGGDFKKLLSYLKSALSHLHVNVNFLAKQKTLNLTLKKPYLGIS